VVKGLTDYLNGIRPWPCPADLDGGGEVNVDDLLEVINNWA
jgi:hypothetical protein